MSSAEEQIVDRLVKHAAAYFSTIRAKKKPPDLDPFLASLMDDAIRAKVGMSPREPTLAPVPKANGVHVNGKGVDALLAFITAGPPEGFRYSELQKAGFSKNTLTRGLEKL